MLIELVMTFCWLVEKHITSAGAMEQAPIAKL
jgi:hypothetical protein